MKSRLPQTFEKLTPEIRSEAQAAIVEFLTVVKDQNAEFIKLCSRTYTKRLHADE